MKYKVRRKVVEALYDLKWAIEHKYITLNEMFNDELDEDDMEEIANFLKKLYWDLYEPDKEYIEFTVKQEEE